MRASLVIIECPKCKSPFEAPRQRKAVCVDVDCRFVFCKECFEPFHEFEDCKEAYIQERIEEMIDIEPDGVTQCPGCRIPYLKNPNACDHVDCETQNCEIDFCFKCACIRSPTLAHGNHYHRPSCPFYNLYDGYDDCFTVSCSECVKAGKLCQKPGNLRQHRRVAKDEAIVK